MNRRTYSVLGGVATLALLSTAVQGTATAAPPADPAPAPTGANAKKDDRPDHLQERQRALKKRAVEAVVTGKARVQDRGGSRSVKVAPGQWVQYELEDTDQLFSILVEFGENKTPRYASAEAYPDAPAGPLHNEIPAPGPEDNSTYWVEDFDREHYMDMFFGAGESFQDFYEEASSGRYTVEGDVSDWVEVDHHEAAYGEAESHTAMTYFVDDSADAWYAAQKAAGKSDEEIVEYLQTFDEWDRYDGDGDGDFSEPDGYIDHFQAIHAGEGEEAGAPSWAIWSHRWAVNQNGFHEDGIGPENEAKFGGIKIGETDFWIRDYTTEPENGGLGVFAHEYAHDLGLPDLYDTAGGENSTGFWTLMSSGSWLSHGDGAIGTTPNHMGPWEKMMLGWLDFETAQAGKASKHKLGPASHATKKAQAVLVELPTGEKTVEVSPAAEDGGNSYFYSGTGDERQATTTSPEFTVPADGTLTAITQYSIETDWDYAFVEISEDGETWDQVETNLSTTTDPEGQNDGFGITGSTDGEWVPLTADLGDWAGKTVQLRFRMFNDAAYHELGFLVDNIAVGSALTEDVEDGAADWTLDGFTVIEGGGYTVPFEHFYLAENRTYTGYDETLREGPYNFGWGVTAPNKVEHFPYQDGMLVWYWDTFYSDNNTSQHPGGGEVLPVDARGAALTWSDGEVVRNRIQTFDATFGLERTDAISLHRETQEEDETEVDMTTLEVGSQPRVRVFDDTKGERYYDPANPGGSVEVPDTGTQIKVLNRNRTGMMQIQVY